MFDSPRPVKPVSAYLQRFALCGTLALAGAAMLPLPSVATLRHAAHGAVAVSARAHPVGHGLTTHAHARLASHQQTQVSSTSSHHGKKAFGMRTADTPVRTPASSHSKKAISKPGRYNRATHHAGSELLAKAQPIERTTPQPPHIHAQEATEDRVHAWYKAQHPSEQAPSKEVAVNAASSKPLAPSLVPALQTPAPIVRVDAPAPAPAKPVIQLSQAALHSDEAVHAAAAVSASHTSTDDDAAITEESHIPSTAPTERTATPFTHGDFNIAAHTTGPAAPVLRASSPAANALLASGKPVPVDVVIQQASNPAAATFATVPTASSMVKLTPVDEDAANAASLVKVNLYDSAGKLILIPPMKGTHKILVHQNTMAVADGLQRISNDAQLAEMRRERLLVALPETEGIGVDERLPQNRRYARPWSVRFLSDLSRAHFARFHSPLIVTSAVRTVAFQRHLVLVNGNAAPPTGDIASPHLYGQAVDIAKHGMGTTEIAWMRAYLTSVETEGKIDVEEEFQQACFHISVYRSYLGLHGQQPAPAQELPPAHALQQAKATPSRHRHLPTALLASGLR